MTYKLKLEVFEGPLDLLLYLIKKNEINIYDIPIAQVTEQYLEYIELMRLLNLDTIGEFLVMAATLMQIKSKMLLPPDPTEEIAEEPDPREELVRRLLEYQQFQGIAENLKDKEAKRQDLFPRAVDPQKLQEIKEDSKEVYWEVSLFDLMDALTKTLNRQREETIYELDQDEYTIEGKIHDILHLLLNEKRIVLRELWGGMKTKSEIIVTFLAILELIRLREIIALQKRLFDDIEIVRNKENVEAPSEA